MPDATALRVLLENGPHDVNIRDFIWSLPNEGPPRILTTYNKTTPESVEQGDFSESGWEDEDGVDMTPDEWDREDGLTAATKAAKWLQDKGAYNTSASHFHPGMWYSTEWSSDYRTGEETEYNFHLKGFTEAEEQEIFELMRRRH